MVTFKLPGNLYDLDAAAQEQLKVDVAAGLEPESIEEIVLEQGSIIVKILFRPEAAAARSALAEAVENGSHTVSFQGQVLPASPSPVKRPSAASDVGSQAEQFEAEELVQRTLFDDVSPVFTAESDGSGLDEAHKALVGQIETAAADALQSSFRSLQAQQVQGVEGTDGSLLCEIELDESTIESVRCNPFASFVADRLTMARMADVGALGDEQPASVHRTGA